MTLNAIFPEALARFKDIDAVDIVRYAKQIYQYVKPKNLIAEVGLYVLQNHFPSYLLKEWGDKYGADEKNFEALATRCMYRLFPRIEKISKEVVAVKIDYGYVVSIKEEVYWNRYWNWNDDNPGLAIIVDEKMKFIKCVPHQSYAHLKRVSKNAELVIDFDITPYQNLEIIEGMCEYDDYEYHCFRGVTYECPISHSVLAKYDRESWYGYAGAPGSKMMLHPFFRSFDSPEELTRWEESQESWKKDEEEYELEDEDLSE